MGYIQPRGRVGQPQNTNNNSGRYPRGRQNYPRGSRTGIYKTKTAYSKSNSTGTDNHLDPTTYKHVRQKT